MRVLHFGRFYAGDRVGGIERHVATLLQGLAAHIEVDDLVANLAWRSDVVRAPGYDVYRARSLGIVASVPLAPTLPLIGRRLWAERRYDLVHLHFPDPLSRHRRLRLRVPGYIDSVWSSCRDVQE